MEPPDQEPNQSSDTTCSVALICIPFKLPFLPIPAPSPTVSPLRLPPSAAAVLLPRRIMHIPTRSSVAFLRQRLSGTGRGEEHISPVWQADRHTEKGGRETEEGPLVSPRPSPPTNHFLGGRNRKREKKKERLGCENYASAKRLGLSRCRLCLSH